MVNFLIKLFYSGGNFSSKEVIKLILIAISLILSVISVYLTRKYFSYEGKYITSSGIMKISSKGWFAVAVVFGFWGAIACLAATIESIRNLPKICNKCGAVTKNQYSVCKNCLAEDNFTLVDAEKIIINERFKIPAIILTVISTLTYIAGNFIN